jgi:hypothetical protein
VNPAEIRRRILAEHGKLRAMLDALVPLAQRFERGEDVDAKWLREEALALYETFAAHLLHEESTLEPALRARGADGERLADPVRAPRAAGAAESPDCLRESHPTLLGREVATAEHPGAMATRSRRCSPPSRPRSADLSPPPEVDPAQPSAPPTDDATAGAASSAG